MVVNKKFRGGKKRRRILVFKQIEFNDFGINNNHILPCFSFSPG